jgi:chemotaxis protein methyltransferase CheR
MHGPFQVIFCRNVVIYFDKVIQKQLFQRFAEILAPEGYLFIGHSENLFGVSEQFRSIGRTIYRKVN